MNMADYAELERNATKHRDENEGIAGGVPFIFTPPPMHINQANILKHLQTGPSSFAYLREEFGLSRYAVRYAVSRLERDDLVESDRTDKVNIKVKLMEGVW